MTDRAYQLLANSGKPEDLVRLDKRLQCGPQIRVRKSPNSLGGPQWMVDSRDRISGAYSWLEAIEIALKRYSKDRESYLA